MTTPFIAQLTLSSTGNTSATFKWDVLRSSSSVTQVVAHAGQVSLVRVSPQAGGREDVLATFSGLAPGTSKVVITVEVNGSGLQVLLDGVSKATASRSPDDYVANQTSMGFIVATGSMNGAGTYTLSDLRVYRPAAS
jgi:hypothetical protein